MNCSVASQQKALSRPESSNSSKLFLVVLEAAIGKKLQTNEPTNDNLIIIRNDKSFA
jgi:hypothetical protein